jgi:hypothetical protein
MEDYRMKIATMRVDDEEHQLFQGEDVKILDQQIEQSPPLLHVRSNVRAGKPCWIPKTNVMEIRPDAQEIIEGTIRHLRLGIRCEVKGYRNENYLTDFFTRENALIEGVNIPEEWVEDSDPAENVIRDELRSLLKKLEKEVV